MGFLENLGKGLATGSGYYADFKNIKRDISLTIGFLVSLGLTILFFVLANKGPKRLKTVGHIKRIPNSSPSKKACTSYIEHNTDDKHNTTSTVEYDCNFELTYTVNKKEYKREVTLTNQYKNYNYDDKLDIYYLPSDHSDYEIGKSSVLLWIAWIMLILTIISGISLPIYIYWSYFVWHHKNIAMVQGGVEAVGDIASLV